MTLIPWKNKVETASLLSVTDRPMDRLRNEMESLFDRFLGDRWSTGFTGDSELAPWFRDLRADLVESDDTVTVTVEAPGVDPKDLDISVTGQTLTIRGEKRQDREEKKSHYHYVERSFGSFQRNILLPAGIDAGSVNATFKNGVVTIQLAKRPEAKPKRIPVKSA